jgi:uncharacterized membrane protein
MSDWYYAVDNEQKGPINEAELKEHLAGNKVPPDTLVWKDGMDNWTPANQVPAFSFRQPPIPAKVQPSTIDHTVTKAVNPNAPSAATTPGTNPSSTTPVDLSNIVGTPEALEVDFNDAEKNKVFGILAYIIFFIPLIAAKDSPFAKYHANQGLALFITMIVSLTVLTILSFIPFIGFVFSLLHVLVYLGFLVLVVLGIVNAAAGKCVPLPVIGGIKLIK